ncbi:MAG TPA: amidohydrolase [Firmicutes bacterium]|nr:amidohydrolase [Candidatus Fermentithermobacillaceae bacterium]
MDKAELKKRVCEAIDRKADEIRAIKTDIWQHPELGFKEKRTSELVARVFERLDLPCKTGLAMTGVRADLEGSKSGPCVGIFGELDAVVCWNHPEADRATGAVHACGHDAQVAAMLGAAMGLVYSDAREHLAGKVVFFAVPAEEFVELEYRSKLKEEGKIEFFGGKQELLRLGHFDDIDLAEMIHVESDFPARSIKLGAGSNGFVGKTVRYIGREAHAGAAPYLGINALNAALLGIMGIHAQRETFKDEDHIRVHPIITRGGDLVNIVPADVRLEMYVRGAKTEAIFDANRKVNRALKAGAMAIGAEVDIRELPGYLPLRPSEPFSKLFEQNAKNLLGDDGVQTGGFSGGSTDMGDISHIIPSIHPYVGGVQGAAHTRTFKVVDLDMVTVIPAKLLAMTVVDLLYDDASTAKKVMDEFEPAYSKESYLEMWRKFISGE